MTPAQRARALAVASSITYAAFAVEMIALVTLVFDVRAVVVGTLACATLCFATLYAAYEGFDEALRRPK